MFIVPGVFPKQMILFRDEIGYFPPGHLFYPESLNTIADSLSELVREEIRRPKYFKAHVQELLDHIIEYFDAIHETHTAALTTYQQYRSEGRQYCLYLRSFMLSGSSFASEETLQHTIFWKPTDYDLKRFIKLSLGGRTNCLTFLNTNDLLSPVAQGTKDGHMPSFRVLDHNWRENVREVIKGAKLIVLDLSYVTDGVVAEVELVWECSMAHRTICLVRKDAEAKQRRTTGPFREVIEVSSLRDMEKEELNRLQRTIGNLANDAFRQTQEVADLSDLKCYVVDKHIELSGSYKRRNTAGVEYEYYLPSSLASNWAALVEYYPNLVKRWGLVEEMIREGNIDAAIVGGVMFQALHLFPVAATLERYEEMSFAVYCVGTAHWLISDQTHIRNDCWEHAAKCATWHGDPQLAEWYLNLLTQASSDESD